MKFLADESLEELLVVRIREDGHDVVAVAESNPGTDDRRVLERAVREGRILITNDKDFAELAFLQRLAADGIVLLRMPKRRSAQKAARLLEVVRQEGAGLRALTTVIQDGAFRRRAFPRSRS